MEWMLMPLRRYAEFSGRSRRKEYWMYALGLILVTLVIGVIEGAVGLDGLVLGLYGPLSLLVALGTLVPSLAVGVRRLHDTNRSGWWLLVPIAPYALSVALLISGQFVIAGIVSMLALLTGLALLVFMVLDGTAGPNRFGPDPKRPDNAEVFS